MFRLSDAEPAAPVPVETPPPKVTRLGDAETRALLDRLPPLPPEASDDQPVVIRDRSLPPPRPGMTITEAFPPPAGGGPSAPAPAAGPLAVLRHAPDGPVPLAAQVSVTFSQPMAAVASHAELARAPLPVRLSPPQVGEWRWIGTQTVLFEPAAERLPMATDYEAEVPAGTRSATGGTLASPARWTFSTPAPTVVSTYPGEFRTGLTPVMLVVFDQKIDPAAVLPTVRVKAGDEVRGIRVATSAEIEADEEVKSRVGAALAGRWLAFTSEAPLPPDAGISVTVGPGTPSAEGPKVSAAAHEWHFSTRGPMRVVSGSCEGDTCRPSARWLIRFSNPIDDETFSDDMVRVEPPLAGMAISVRGIVLEISGNAVARTDYRVTVSERLHDRFGQALERGGEATFHVGSAAPTLWSGSQDMAVVEPASASRFPVYSGGYTALDVRIYAVKPEQWPEFEDPDWPTKASPAVAPKFQTRVAVTGSPNEYSVTPIDLRLALTNGIGQVVLVVDPVPSASPNSAVVTWRPQHIRVWIQVTRIGLDALADGRGLLAWASSLSDGRPLAGAQVTLLPAPVSTATTAADGLARLPLKPQPPGLVRYARDRKPMTLVLIARSGSDVAFLSPGSWAVNGWWRSGDAGGLRWSVFDDRRLYRPGEEVSVKGWVRYVRGGRDGGLEPVAGRVKAISYSVTDFQGNEIGTGRATVNAFGGFDFAVKLPPTPNLGPANVSIKADADLFDNEFGHRFFIEEFRRPEFELKAEASPGPHLVGGHAAVTVSATYFAGGGLASTPVTWSATASRAEFTPPNREAFTFGGEGREPWWEARDFGAGRSERRVRHVARTDSSGRHVLRIDFDSVSPPEPMTVRAEAVVEDVNRQTMSAAAVLLVHPAALYVGLKTDRYFVNQGQPLEVDAITTDLEGRAVSGRSVSLVAERLDWRREKGEWTERAFEPQHCSITSGETPSRCSFRTATAGTYRVTATVVDDAGRPNRSQIRRWVAGTLLGSPNGPEEGSVTLVADRKEYRPGDTAEVLVVPPFAPAEAVLTVARAGIVRIERFTVASGSSVLRVPIEERWIPGAFVRVDVVGAASNGAPKGGMEPAFASGSIELEIPPLSRSLEVRAVSRAGTVRPGATTTVDLDVHDSRGRPAGDAEVAVVVVDEAVLALTDREGPNPLRDFYAPAGEGVEEYRLRRHLVRPATPAPVEIEGGVAGGVTGGLVGGALDASPNAAPVMAPTAPPPPPPPPPSMVAMTTVETVGLPTLTPRRNFSALALFAPSVRTDRSGHAEVSLKLPDSLTRYRVIAVAATSGVEFGTGESTITASLPLMARATPPRFLNLDDRFELPVVVQNLGETPADVAVAIRAANATPADGSGRRVTVPANGRVEVRFPVAAGQPGSAGFQVIAASSAATDSSEFSVPIRTPATTEAFATYGQIDDGATAQPIRAPSDALSGFGGLELTTSSTALQALSDAVAYLVAYPYECAEQRASRLLGVVALRDVLGQFGGTALADRQKIEAGIRGDIAALEGMQNSGGGFGLWRRDEKSWPFLSVHVTHALERARAAGFHVSVSVLDEARHYVQGIEKVIPKDYPDDARNAIIAYSLFVRKQGGHPDIAGATRLVQRVGLAKLPAEALGWLLAIFAGDAGSAASAAEIRTYLNNHVAETAGAAHFVTSYSEGAHLLFASDRRADAVILDALIGDQPENDLIPKLVEGLLAHRTAGRWESTQENCFVLLALGRYFRAYEKATPDFVARAWLGDGYLGERVFKGRSAERYQLTIPMADLAATRGAGNLVLSKDGPGRLYYRIGLQYAPKTLDLGPLDRGFAVQREYAAVDDPSDVRQDKDGTWHIRAGARVRVRLSMVAPTRRYHVALVDPLPAGLEPLNPALRGTESVPEDKKVAAGPEGRPAPWWFWTWPWFDHQNLRDDRVEAFTTLLWDGVYTYSYVARATTPGQFVVPPPKAEEMYHAETFGRGATDRVVVEIR